MSRDALIHVIISTRNTSVYFAYSRYNSIQHTTLTHAGLYAYTHPHYQYLSPNMHIFISYIYIFILYASDLFVSISLHREKIDHISYGSYGAWPRQARAFEEVIERFYQRYPNQSLGATF